MAAVEAGKRAAEEERDTLQAKVNEVEDKMMEMDAEYVEFDKKHMELVNDIQELWDAKEAEREEVLLLSSQFLHCSLLICR